MKTKATPAPPLARATARLDLVASRLALAKNVAEPMPIEPADAEALYELVWRAQEDLMTLSTAPAGPGEPSS